MPGLAEAIAKNRFLPPTLLAPYRLDLLAALAIADHDPWPGADAWLADHIGQAESLIEGHEAGPELGATAAAILLKRHGQNPAAFGILPLDQELPKPFRVSGCRFRSKDAAAKVQEWWRGEKNRRYSIGAPRPVRRWI